ncbi:DNA-binding protein [Proteus faecis]|uniref:DNA-binding protein n=3 Tax=Proteus faecis TaxID=2050967 RepID=A0AAW7CT53_9GAMM|nr:PPC domain-containing DNA-binding protein [Proteus faecis]MDL5166952.1 DNA-binding protein [Proteus faecis]MDL5274942.1 DNA-binding protein [Proteus faecis]MDL5278511.1 DNA-binding protein [Proteus faecis]MDL5307513.1 DNA-binding protein [Proteus faecis]MDL5311072.1 DNA-binding protein [Proteus faecis]
MSQAQHPSSHVRFIAVRLIPGEDVIVALRQIIADNQLQSSYIAGCVGSLTDVALRFAGREENRYLTGKFEIVSLIGTLDAIGEHLHLAVSDENGIMCGGHMMPGCTVRTTLELVIGELEQVTFSRQPCEYSGYEELVITPR